MPPELTSAIAVAALIVALFALLLVIAFGWRGRRRRSRAAQGADPGAADLAPAVERALMRLDELTRKADELDRRTGVVEDQGKRSVQHVGIVRYNPFEDTGGNQSFALAMLDSKHDGLVISSLHSRNQTRLYVKAIVGGKSETALSTEETEALRKAAAP